MREDILRAIRQLSYTNTTDIALNDYDYLRVDFIDGEFIQFILMTDKSKIQHKSSVFLNTSELTHLISILYDVLKTAKKRFLRHSP